MEERLQKYMARCGVASRRKCEEIILAGKVKVNGMIINELGTKVTLDDIVEYEGKRILPEENKVYIMLNKPEGVITSAKDEKGRKTILDIVKVEERVYPIGRLDYDSSGLLLLTNDGDIYNNIIELNKKIADDKKELAICKGMKICPNCGAEQYKEVMNCTVCGMNMQDAANIISNMNMESQEKVCPSCGMKITEGAKFCAGCGTRIEN